MIRQAPTAITVSAALLVGLALPYTPLAPDLGLRPLPGAFLAYLVGVIVAYLAMVEVVKRRTLSRALG